MQQLLSDYLHGVGTLESVTGPEDFAALCSAVRGNAALRLRWKLDRRLGIPPWNGTPGRDECLLALAQLRADREEALDSLCPACRAQVGEGRCRSCGGALPTENPAFDEARFEELKHDGAAL